MNKKGQALIEFIVILPILAFLLLSIVDLSNFISTKNKLENKTNDVIAMMDDLRVKEDIEGVLNQDTNQKITVDFSFGKETTTIVLKTKIKVNTPGLNLIFGTEYPMTVKRVIYNE